MNDKLQIFENSEFGQVRVILSNDKPLFCLSDVSRVLGLTNPSQVKERLEEDGMQMIDLQTLSNNEGVIINELGSRQATFINEPNLYRVIFQSRKYEAKHFQDWVFNDVLPSIRKTGQYSAQHKLPISFAEALKLAYEQQLQIEQQQLLLAEAQPKVAYYDSILSSKDCLTVTQIAKDYGLSAQRLNTILNEERVQYKQSGQWLPYVEYAQEGYTKSETVNFTHKDGSIGTKLNTKWTQKGRLFIHEILKKKQVKPLMDR